MRGAGRERGGDDRADRGGDRLGDDPAGYSACTYLDKSIAGYGDVEEGLGNQLLAGEAAADAETPEIRDAATAYTEGVDAYKADADALRSACEGKGFEFEN